MRCSWSLRTRAALLSALISILATVTLCLLIGPGTSPVDAYPVQGPGVGLSAGVTGPCGIVVMSLTGWRPGSEVRLYSLASSTRLRARAAEDGVPAAAVLFQVVTIDALGDAGFRIAFAQPDTYTIYIAGLSRDGAHEVQSTQLVVVRTQLVPTGCGRGAGGGLGTGGGGLALPTLGGIGGLAGTGTGVGLAQFAHTTGMFGLPFTGANSIRPLLIWGIGLTEAGVLLLIWSSRGRSTHRPARHRRVRPT